MIITFDMGATHTRVAASSDGVTLTNLTLFNTGRDYASGLKNLSDAIRKAANTYKISAIVGGISSALNPEHSALIMDSNIADWNHKPLRDDLSQNFSAPVQLFNDVELIGLGEATFGSGRGNHIVGYLTFSSGVNGVRIIDGKVDRNTFGFEIGEHIIAFNNATPLRLEDATGGKALQKKYGLTPEEIAMDPKIWNQVIKYAAVGTHNALLFWSPDIIIFGGSMMKDIPLARLRKEVQSLLSFLPEPPEFRMAELGDRGGLLGALALGRELEKS